MPASLYISKKSSLYIYMRAHVHTYIHIYIYILRRNIDPSLNS